MFPRALSLLVLSIPLLAAASAIPRNDGNECTTGSLECCDSTVNADTDPTNVVVGIIEALVGPVTGLIGINCDPITIIGGGGDSCSEQPVCCSGNSFNSLLGVLTIACSPININV